MKLKSSNITKIYGKVTALFLALILALVSCSSLMDSTVNGDKDTEEPPKTDGTPLPDDDDGGAEGPGNEDGESKTPPEDNDSGVDERGFTVFPEGDYLEDAVFAADEYLPGYDYNSAFLHLSTDVCATEDTLYFVYNYNRSDKSIYMLYYADKATGFGGPLCGRAECTHDNDSCNAYIGDLNIWGLSNYDGRLYWVGRGDAGWQIFSAAYDGTNHQSGSQLDSGLVGNTISSSLAFFHRGCFYWAYITDAVVDGEPRQLARVLAFPIDGGEGYVILETEQTGTMLIRPYKDSLYIILPEIESAGSADCDLALYRWDIQTREAETLYHNSIRFSPDEFYVTEDGIILYGNSPTGPAEDPWITSEGEVYTFSFESGELEKLCTFSSEATLFGVSAVDGAIVGAKWTDEGSLTLRVKDFEGGTILDTAIEGIEWYDPNCVSGFINCIGADEKYMYFRDKTRTNTYYAAIPWDGSEVRLLWSSET